MIRRSLLGLTDNLSIESDIGLKAIEDLKLEPCNLSTPPPSFLYDPKDFCQENQQAANSLPADPEDHREDREEAGRRLHRLLVLRKWLCLS